MLTVNLLHGAGKSAAQRILELYAKTDKRLGARKMKLCLAQEYCISISEGRVYRLMKEMNLPKMSTVKPPKQKSSHENSGVCVNLSAQKFNQPALNLDGCVTLLMSG